MTANLPRPSTDENISTTLASGITDVSGTMTVSDASKIVAPCYLVIDRVDSAGAIKTTSLWEYVKVTNVAGNDLTITRAQGGSTAQSHSSGAVVEAVVTSSFFEDWYNVLNPEHDSAGGHVITGTMTIAGMNLASVATIAVASIGTLNANTFNPGSLAVSTLVVTSIASIARGEFKTLQAASVASIAMPSASVFNKNMKLDKAQNAVSTSDIATSSTSYVDYTGLSVTFTPDVASNLLVLFQSTFYFSSSAGDPIGKFVVNLDGSISGNDPLISSANRSSTTGNYDETCSGALWISGATAASHTLKIQAKTSSGTLNTRYGSLTVIPFAS